MVDKLVWLQKSFIWGEGEDQKKLAWVKWETTCIPKEKDGLGVWDLASFNRALLGKWWWNLFHHTDELWAKVLKSKYGAWRNLDEVRRNHKESIWWRDLCFVCGLEEEGGWLKEGVKWKIGCGSKVKFWKDPICIFSIKCSCKVSSIIAQQKLEDWGMQFLCGLNYQYSNVRSHVLLMDPLPPISKIFFIYSSARTSITWKC